MIDKLFVLLNDITDRESGDIIEKIGIEDRSLIKLNLKNVQVVVKRL